MKQVLLLGFVVLLAGMTNIAVAQPNPDFGYENEYGSRDNWYGEESYSDQFQQRRGNRPVVRVIPRSPVRVVRGIAPSRWHVWIPAEYRWRGRGYVCIPGYWALPPQRGARYVAGYWQRTRGGYVWVSGRWNMGGRNRW